MAAQPILKQRRHKPIPNGQLRPLPKDYIAGNHRKVFASVQKPQSLQDLSTYPPHDTAQLQLRLENLSLIDVIYVAPGLIESEAENLPSQFVR
jgi:hypothetical protein